MASGGTADAKLSLRVKSKKSQSAVLRDLSTKETVKEFLDKLSDLTEVPADRIALLKGFPPKRISYDNEDLVESLGLKHQDTIIVELDTTGSPNKGENPLDESIAKAPASESEPGVKKKQVPTIYGTATSGSATPNAPSYADLIPSNEDHSNGLLLRHIVPSDNSCLFTSVTFCLSGQIPAEADGGSRSLREMIANTVASDLSKYNEAILGRPNKDYVNWIKKPESWGGGIELSIMAEFYGVQISVVDTQSLNISCFGEDHNFAQRIFLIYDGIHYDPLYFEPYTGGTAGAQKTVFETSDERMMELAMQLAKEAKASHQFTDTKNFRLRCQVCNTLLKGEVEAQEHAMKTAHASFAEIEKK